MTPIKPDAPRPVREGEAPDLLALSAYLRVHAPHIGDILDIAQFPGGFSNLTYCLRAASGEYVLRRPPFGAQIKGGHDMGREFRVLSLLKKHYPLIPQPIVFCDDEQIIGAPFYVMSRLRGAILRVSDAPKYQLPPQAWRQASTALVDNLAALHALDIEQTGLARLGKPEGYMTRQVEGWIKRYGEAQTETIADMESVAAWLPEHLPHSPAPALLHNDYKYDNVVFDPADLSSIRGVLDWEMATVGDPLMDLGAALAYWVEADEDGAARQLNLTWLPGNLDRGEVVAHYAEKSGRDVSNIVFYYVFGLYKNAVIAQQIYARWKKGYTRDPRFGQLAAVVREVAAKALRAFEHDQV
jgi:aminoglycoside phosphotransferase (APT) family kinase protein